jgi:hypothetical protein
MAYFGRMLFLTPLGCLYTTANIRPWWVIHSSHLSQLPWHQRMMLDQIETCTMTSVDKKVLIGVRYELVLM